MLLKICGAVAPAEVALLAGAGADLIGLWHGVGGGPAEPPADALPALARAAREAGAEPVLVTFLRDPAALAGALERSGARWVQLHGYQPPGLVRALRAAAPPGLTVVKALHVRGAECPERPLLAAYERAGVDFFLLDSVTAAGRVGSTGRRLDPAVALGLADATTRPFLLAGGVRAADRHAFAAVTAHPRCAGIDVDTGARGPDRAFDPERITALREWMHERVH